MHPQPPVSPSMLATTSAALLVAAVSLGSLTGVSAQTSPAFGPLASPLAKSAPPLSPDSPSRPASAPSNVSTLSPRSLQPTAPLVLLGPQPDAVVMGDYLALLGQIAPAAELGARDYLAAFRLRCGLAMTSEELRRAFSSERGDPVLMGLIRASQSQNAALRQALIARVACPAGAVR